VAVVVVSFPLVVGAGAITVLVGEELASLAGAWLLLLQPAKTRGRAASVIRRVTSIDDIFMNLFL
jgi:hypothetical protein